MTYFRKMKSLVRAAIMMFFTPLPPLFAITSAYLIVAPVAMVQSSKAW